MISLSLSIRRSLLALLIATVCSAAYAQECVVVLHGLLLNTLVMKRIEYRLEAQGYVVKNMGYPSSRKPIETLANVVGKAIDRCKEHPDITAIHFVGHSMGGILVRQYFQNHSEPLARKMVMLGPPNHGSEIIDAYGDDWWFKPIGPASRQLGTAADSLTHQLKAIPLDIGVIAGNHTNEFLLSRKLPKPHDGKVSVASAQLAEMRDFIVMPKTHTIMVYSGRVIDQVGYFLAHGYFDHMELKRLYPSAAQNQ